MTDSGDYDVWPTESLRDALKEAEDLYRVLGALQLGRVDHSEKALHLRKLRDKERHQLRLDTASKITDIRMSLRRRISSS